MKAMPNPLNAGGTLEYLIFSRMAAIAIIAKNQPKPEPIPKATESPKLYSRETMNNEPPKMAQFTVIKGRKIPKELYKDGENFSMTISTNCTIDAITAMNKMNRRKVRSCPKIPVSDNRYSLMSQLIGIVIPKTKITANPKPNAVLMVFETAR